MSGRVWKDIQGFEGFYQVSNDGKIKSLRRSITLKQSIKNREYAHVILQKRGIKKTITTHRLVALHFVSNPDSLPEVNHINGIKSDNRTENLEWCTSKYNSNHSDELGLRPLPKGELNGMSKLTEEDVIEIYKLAIYKTFTQAIIGGLYGVKKNAVSSIKLKTTWKHVTDKVTL